MKRCPACNRIETDEALGFCRADGTALISDSGPVGAKAGTVKFGSAPVVSEIETSILPQTVTNADMSRPTAPTTVLPASRIPDNTQKISKPKQRKVVVAMAVLIVLVTGALAVSAYFYLSRKNNAAIESVAVLPFQNASGDPNMEYLSDGIAESLMNSLSQLPNLKVMSRNTAFRYKGKEQDAEKVGKELNVRAVLTGSLKQVGDRIVINVSLDDALASQHIWGAQYDRNASDLLSVQREIARDIADNLRLKLSGADEQKLAKNHTVNPEAYQLYLKGRFYWNKRTEKDILRAIEYFQQAIAIDPSYALAYAGLADAYSILPGYSNSPPRETMPKAHEFALKALALDNNLAEAHAALGAILETYNYDFAGAEREYKNAIELNPNYATAHQWYGELLSFLGRHEESFVEFRRALELDPYSLIINRVYGETLFRARKYDESVAQLKKTIEMDANFAPAFRSLFSTYQAKGNHAESVEALARYFELLGNYQDAALARESFAQGGWQKFLRAMTGERRPVNLPSHIGALFFAELGEKDKAFSELDRAYYNRESYLKLIKTDPRFDPLRSDPRFQELVRKVGFPQ